MVRFKFKQLVQLLREFKESGAALVTSLLVLLVLVLLGLSLLLLGNTEHLIALNEQDSQRALMHDEEGMTMARHVIYTRSNPATGFQNFSDMLDGPNSTDGDADDNQLGFDFNNDSVSDLDTSLTPSSLNLTNEQTTSVLDTIDGLQYETFRRGIDTDGDGVWDGPRSLVHIRIDDNYDEAPSTNDPLSDTDKRIHATIVSEYPIWVDSSGAESTRTIWMASSGTASHRGLAERTLVVEFEPQTLPAISTEGSLTLDGNVRVCGDCGDIHANTNITLTNDPKVCGDATASQTFTNDTTDNSNVSGLAAGSQPTIDIPVINPYDFRWVPLASEFDTHSNPETGLPSILQCYAYDATTNPGGTKYFALVADSGKGKVYKAYPDTTGTQRWVWKLIDDLNYGSGVQLDNCGRVKVPDIADVAGDLNNAGMVILPDTNTVDPTDARSTAVNDGQADTFYGFQLQHIFEQSTCSDTDTSLSGGTLVQNNWTVNDRSNIVPSTSAAAEVVLPAGCNYHDDFTTACTGATTNDTTPDFDPTHVQPTDLPTNRGQWLTTSNDTWSPLYGAVVFVFGHVRLAGNLATLKNSGADMSLPNSRWRISVMTTGYIDVAGTPAYATAVTDIIPQLFVAGRDVELSGNANGSPRECGRTAGTYCTFSGGVSSFAGFIGAHEQINMSGNTSLDGFMIAEDAANCGTKVNSATGISTFNGVPSVQYDCEHPPNPFDTGVRAKTWQEVQ